MNTFKTDIKEGLSAKSKSLSSKYFYDKIGDALFMEIMELPEYYLTRAELEIFQKKTDDLIDSIEVEKDTYFELIELGAGDGTKTKELLKRLEEKQFNFTYVPIDISHNALEIIEQSIKKSIPAINIKPKQGDYFKVLPTLHSNVKKVILFLGSNIGNLTDSESTLFMKKLSASLNQNDNVILGVDLIKPENIVLPAYNDSKGITSKFNLNLLSRINKELGGNFILSNFKHTPEYSEKTGVAKSSITSLINQEVYIEELKNTFEFAEGEQIQTEISRKYNSDIIQKITKGTNLKVINKLGDSKQYFANYIFKRQ